MAVSAVLPEGGADPEVLVEVVRSGFAESRHSGSVTVLDADGQLAWSIGAITAPVFPRSCNKLLQTMGMLRLGLRLEGELLALATASHSGEDFHIEGVRRILADYGLSEDDLQTPPDLPLDDATRLRYFAAGHDPNRLAMNCSGKHAAMLATCVIHGWPLASYRDPRHPLQVAIAETAAELTGEPVAAVGVDGCGAPVLAFSLLGLARAYHRLVLSDEPAARQLVQAIVAHPEYLSGTRRDEAALLRAIPGAIAKAGAESCYALALPDGQAAALKIEDGSPRARAPVMAAVLERMDLSGVPSLHIEAVRQTGVTVVCGGGEPVGELRVAHPLLTR